MNVYPTAPGHQMDLNLVWAQIQELSEVLAANREATRGLLHRVGEARRLVAEEAAAQEAEATAVAAGGGSQDIDLAPGAQQQVSASGDREGRRAGFGGLDLAALMRIIDSDSFNGTVV